MEINLMSPVSRSVKPISICVLILIIAVIGCGGNGGGSRPDVPSTAAEYSERGWERFEAGNFDGALSDFDDALGLDANWGPAYLGQGWSRLSLATSTSSMQLATASFDSALTHGQALTDCLSGRAAAYLSIGGNPAYISAISDALLALQFSPNFTFAHRNSFNFKDLRLIIAFAFAGQNHFPTALSAADELSDSGIVQGDSGTWVVGGVSYNSFKGAVLAQLQKLSDEHSG
jgi:tetratricopeptide (TPR) repeat protein